MAEQIIKAENVSFAYTGAEGVAPSGPERRRRWTLKRGASWRCWATMARGKSTLAKHFNAILLPSGGKVYVDGMDTTDEERTLDIRQHGRHGVPEPG